ncbi:MFS transporter [Altererythrobacter endophyticus]|uniref:MFS transporter n=2 Tax=Altericroceibacterium endophyticum TaxID=1808508 RepID=A0A6I4T5I4_9SPHN|nr:MFS transporter [Altericroceibacterium endophyticum]
MAAPNPSSKVSKAGWYTLFLVSTMQAMSLLDRQILSILATNIRDDLGIGDAELGLLYGTVFALFYALFSLPLGRLADGWIRTKLLAICITIWSLSTGMAAFAGGFAMLALSRLGVGIGEAAAQPGGNSLIFDTFPKNRRGIAMAAMAIAVAIGLGASMILGGVAAEWWDTRYASVPAPLDLAGWQFAFLVAAAPGLILAFLLYKLKEPVRGAMEGIPTKPDPHPFRASGAVLTSVTPGLNWWMLWRRDAGAKQWLANISALAFILILCISIISWAQGFSPRPGLELGVGTLDPHLLQWFVVGFGLFVIFNLFQSFKLSDRPTYAVVLSPSLLLLMIVGGLQSAINYGVMGFTPSFIIRTYELSPAEAGLQFGLLAAALGILGPVIAGPLTDWVNTRMPGVGRVLLALLALGVSPIFGIWTFSADDAGSFYLRFTLYSLILTMWMPPVYAMMYDLVLPRMRGITSSLYIVIMTLLGLGIGPYAVGMISDANGGDLAGAIIAINLVSPVIVVLLVIVAIRVRRDEATLVDRARAAGEDI